MAVIHTSIPHYNNDELNSLCGLIDGDWDEDGGKISFYCNGCCMVVGGGTFDMRGCTKLPVSIKQDGIWLVIKSFDGKSATIRLEDIFEYKTPINKGTFEAWLAERDSYRQYH